MRSLHGTLRRRLGCMLLLAAVSGCVSAPPAGAPLPPDSSVLGVDVVFPVSLGRDPSLTRAYFVRGPVHAGLTELPQLVPATFVNESRAYLLDPKPGTYSLVAVVSDFAPPRSAIPSAGVMGTAPGGPDVGHATILPSETIGRTRTTIAPGAVKFMGALWVVPGDRINADSVFVDTLQERLAEIVRPGVTSKSGISGRFSTTWTLDSEQSSFRNALDDRDAFSRNAIADFGLSPWAAVIPPPVPSQTDTAYRRDAAPARVTTPEAAAPPRVPTPETAALPRAPMPEATAPTEVRLDPVPTPATPPAVPQAPRPQAWAPNSAPDVIAPEPKREEPKRRRFPNVPAGTRLASVEFGMSHEEVREVLGDPDDRSRYFTARGWLPFYTGPDAMRIDWIYEGQGRVVFSVMRGDLSVLDVQPDADAPR